MAGRDRSLSPRDRRKSYYSDDDYDYSDSFVSDDEPDHHRSTGRGRKISKVGRKPPKGRSRGANRTQSNPPKLDAVVQRVLSAKKLKINELRNQVEELHTALKDVGEENKLLKKMQHRQEKALHKFEDRESDLPQLMQRHNNEVKTLRDQLRKTKDKHEKNDRYLRDAEDELDRVKNKLKKYKKLADEEQLLERDELSKKVKQYELDLEEKESRLKDLEKHITHLNKNHRHEIGIEIARNRDAQRNLEKLREDNEKLEKILKEKEKELEIKNIYSNRVLGSRRFNSYNGTPHGTPPPKPRKRAPSLHDLTPRDKMKMYEEKRRSEEKKKQEIKLKNEEVKPAFQFSDQSKEYNARAKTREKSDTRSNSKFSNSKPNQKNKREIAPFKPNFRLNKGGDTKDSYSKDNSKYDSYHGNQSFDKNKDNKFDTDYGSYDKKYNQRNKYDSESDNYTYGGYKKENNNSDSYYGNKGYGREGNTRDNSYNKKYDFDYRGKPERKGSKHKESKPRKTESYVKWNTDYGDDIDKKNATKSTFSFKARKSPDSLDDERYNYSDDFSYDEYDNKGYSSPWRSKAQEKSRREREERQSKEKDNFFSFDQEEADRSRVEKERREKEERERWEFEENERKAKEEDDWRKRMEREREQQDREERERDKLRFDRERKEREEQEWREQQQREEEERKNRELRERHERDRRERERLEQEQRAKEERERYEMDEQANEARKKKDLLLAKLKQMDENPDANAKVFGAGITTDTNVTAEKSKKKEKQDDLFFLTSTNRGDSASTTSSKKSYKFGKPIENLHHGKPSHEDVSVPYLDKQKKKKDKEDADLLGYQPSFSSKENKTKLKPTGGIMLNEDFAKSKKKEKKSNLMTDLFGNSNQTQASKNNDLDNMFSTSNKTTTNKRTTGSSFPWDDDSKSTTTKFNSTKRENSSTLFGGGSALVDDDFTSNDTSKLLPRRQRQTSSTTFHSRPAVTAVDHYDEDIEEVIL